MPKPITQLVKNPDINMASGAIIKCPELATKAMLVISIWSSIDDEYTRIVSECLHSDYVVVAAMMDAIKNADAKHDAVLAAVKEKYPAEAYELFLAVDAAIKPSKVTRNHFAHHLWGYCPELNCLCLVDPRHIAKEEAKYKQEYGTDYFIVRDKSKIMAYSEQCLEDEVTRAFDADGLVARLRFLNGPTFPETRKWLLDQPEVLRKLQRLFPQKYPPKP